MLPLDGTHDSGNSEILLYLKSVYDVFRLLHYKIVLYSVNLYDETLIYVACSSLFLYFNDMLSYVLFRISPYNQKDDLNSACIGKSIVLYVLFRLLQAFVIASIRNKESTCKLVGQIANSDNFPDLSRT